MSSKPYVAIVGGQSLAGREIRSLLSLQQFPAQVRLIGAESEETGAITEQDGEPVVVSSLDRDNLTGARIVFLTGSPGSSRKAFDLISHVTPAPVVIDLTGGLEDLPSARLRAPFVEPAGYTVPENAVHVVAQAAAIALAMLFTRLHAAHPIRASVVQLLEPASECGQRGIDELQRQTINLLSFKALPKDVYDAQIGFNILAGYGEKAPRTLEDAELRIERHLASLLAIDGAVAPPSLRLMQAPVFHGYSASIWVEFESNPGVKAIEKALASDRIDVRGAGFDPPSNVGMAGIGGIGVGAIAADRNHPRAAWLFLAADNFTLPAENAIAIARSYVVEAA
jgi:aspartate-semialdehyde dehydrogenase